MAGRTRATAAAGLDGGLDVGSALQLAYLHSPAHQEQLETLFRSALDVTAERFRFTTQFFGGYGASYLQSGTEDSSQLTVGRPSPAYPALGARRLFATAGELLVGFANSFVFEFSGSDTNFASSIANDVPANSAAYRLMSVENTSP